VAIKGARAAMRKGSPWLQPVDVTVSFGTPIETAGLTLEDRDKLVVRVRSEVERLLNQ
jgi:hypothetical protein